MPSSPRTVRPFPPLVAGAVAVVLAAAAGAQAPATTAAPQEALDAITLELIMSDPEWIGNPPERPYWEADSSAVYYEQERQGSDLLDLYRVAVPEGEPRPVAEDAYGSAGEAGGVWSEDGRRKLYVRFGDVWLHDLDRGKVQLTRTAEAESDPLFLVDGRVAYRRGDGFYAQRLGPGPSPGLEEQLAALEMSDDPAAEEDPEGFLEEQQMRLFDFLREERDDRRAARETAEERQRRDRVRPPLPWYLGDDHTLVGAALSPDGRHIGLVLREKGHDWGTADKMAAWVTESGYVTVRDVRPKVGTAGNVGESLWLLDLATRTRHEVDLAALPGIADDPLAELRAAAEARRAAADDDDENGDEDGDDGGDAEDEDGDEETGEAIEEQGTTEVLEREEGRESEAEVAAAATAEPEDADEDGDGDDDEEEAEEAAPRPVQFEDALRWSRDGQLLAFNAHSYDNKDRWLAVVEPGEDGGEPMLRPLHRLSDPDGWINWDFNQFDWLRDRSIWFLSEETGWSQLYLVDPESGNVRRLTDGDYLVDEVRTTPDERHLYYIANPEHPGRYETYRIGVADGRIERLTNLGGVNSAIPSPDGRWLLVTHSTATHPPELYLQENEPRARAERLTHTVSERFLSLPWVEPEIVEVPSSHVDRPIYSRYYSAHTFGEPADGKAVIFIHGAGYLQNAHEGWSGYFREFMFHTFLVKHGYHVLDMDYRASRGYGRDWRTAIYRQMGTPELEDLEDGVSWLIAQHRVDPERIGTYGGSYGGFMTMMALFKRPGLFAAGAALRPVTDWAHYNHPYTSNILNTPEVDPEAYERSSPIEFAAGLEDPLLIAAPMQDDNVFFQDTVRLVQRLIELHKEDWEVAIYPVEPHGFRQPSSWLDEYRRIFELFQRHVAGEACP